MKDEVNDDADRHDLVTNVLSRQCTNDFFGYLIQDTWGQYMLFFSFLQVVISPPNDITADLEEVELHWKSGIWF